MRVLVPLVLLVLASALADPGVSLASTSPQRSARLMAGCLRDHGWTASAKGRQVRATGARTRPAGSYPRHPRYSVTFSSPGLPPVEVRWALNDREEHRVNRCLRFALRGGA